MARKRSDKEEYEYVSLIAHDLIVQDVESIEGDIKECLDKTMEGLELHKEKHRLIAKAKETLNNLSNDIKLLESHSRLNLFKGMFKAPAKKIILPKQTPKKGVRPTPEDEYFAVSKRALANLKTNIEDVKKRLEQL